MTKIVSKLHRNLIPRMFSKINEDPRNRYLNREVWDKRRRNCFQLEEQQQKSEMNSSRKTIDDKCLAGWRSNYETNNFIVKWITRSSFKLPLKITCDSDGFLTALSDVTVDSELGNWNTEDEQ